MNGRQIAWAEKWEEQIKEIKEDLENIEDLKSVTMFEKEAEEYFGKETELVEVEKLKIYTDGFKDGYNKANEWHYVKDGDLPKDNGLLMSKTLNLITKMKGSDCLNLALGQYNFSTQEFSYQHIVGLTEVIAWKEIVLPELKESE